MADQNRDHEWLPEETEGQRQSSARTGNTSRFVYTDKHMPNGNYREPAAPVNAGEAVYRSPGRTAPGASANTGAGLNYAQGSGQGTAPRRAAAPQSSRQSPNGQPAQGGQRAYSGSGQPMQNPGSQQRYYSNGQPVRSSGGQRYYSNGQPVQNPGSQQRYYSNGQAVQNPGGRQRYNSNGQPAQNAGGQKRYSGSGQPAQNPGVQQRYYRNGQPMQNAGGQKRYSGSGQPAQNPGGQQRSYGSGQPVQNPGGQRSSGSGQPAQNIGAQRYYGNVQPGQNAGVQRQNTQSRQPVQNAGAVRRDDSRTGNQGNPRPARQESVRRETENGRVAQGQVRRTLPAGSRTAAGEPEKRAAASGRTRGAGDPPRNRGGRDRVSASGSGRRPGEKKKKNVGMIALMVGLLILLGVLVFGVAFIFGIYNKMAIELDTHAIRDVDDVYIDEHVKKDVSQANYTNILLVGIDSRNANVIDYANSDTMILCSINNTTGKVRLVSIYRDTYLNIMSPENVNKFQYNKANAAYNLGSAPQLLSMLNANLDLSIKDYAVVDFRAVMKLVDAVDGIDITLTDQEAIHLNNYQVETAEITGVEPQPIEVFVGEEPRVYHLNGIQATAYCRIRFTNGWDMKRTQRQRLVIEKIIAKVKAGGLGLMKRVIEEVVPFCYTSLDLGEIVGMATRMFSFEIEKTTGFPEIHLGKDISSEIMSAQVPVTLEDNVVALHKWLFDIDSYETSQTVKDFSRQIILNTGYGPEHREEAIADSEIGNSGGEVDQVK